MYISGAALKWVMSLDSISVSAGSVEHLTGHAGAPHSTFISGAALKWMMPANSSPVGSVEHLAGPAAAPHSMYTSGAALKWMMSTNSSSAPSYFQRCGVHIISKRSKGTPHPYILSCGESITSSNQVAGCRRPPATPTSKFGPLTGACQRGAAYTL